MTNLKDIRQDSLNRLNRLRRVQRLLETEMFGFAWGLASIEDRKEILGWIYLGKIAKIEAWVERSKLNDLEAMSLRQLREQASRVGVRYYAKLSKSDLIWEIQNAYSPGQNPQHANGNGTVCTQMGQDSSKEVQRAI